MRALVPLGDSAVSQVTSFCTSRRGHTRSAPCALQQQLPTGGGSQPLWQFPAGVAGVGGRLLGPCCTGPEIDSQLKENAFLFWSSGLSLEFSQ